MNKCGDCGQPAIGSGSARDLTERGWKLLRLRDAYGNPVLWWRCPRCSDAGARAQQEVSALLRATK